MKFGFMKISCWLVLGAMVATSATAQNNTNTAPAPLPPIPAPATAAPAPAPAAAPAPDLGAISAPATTNAPEKKVAHKKKKHSAPKSEAKKTPFTEPSIALNPGPAEVTVSNLNLRGQAGLKGEFISHVNKGDTVTVLSEITLDKHKADEPAQWAKIALPSSVEVWVNSQFVDSATKTVKSKKLNLRAGPGENFSVLGVLEKGDVVNVTGEKNGWSKIDAPTNSYAFVAAMYLNQAGGGLAAGATPPPSAETQPMPAPTPTPVAEQQPIAPAGGAPEMAQNPPPAPAPAPAPAPDNTAAAAAAMTDTNMANVDTNLPPPPPRIATHEGFVRHVKSLIEPTAYELYDPKTDVDIDYLYTTSTNLDLSRYNNLHIIVTGEEGMVERWPKTPLMTIQKIQVLDK